MAVTRLVSTQSKRKQLGCQCYATTKLHRPSCSLKHNRFFFFPSLFSTSLLKESQHDKKPSWNKSWQQDDTYDSRSLELLTLRSRSTTSRPTPPLSADRGQFPSVPSQPNQQTTDPCHPDGPFSADTEPKIAGHSCRFHVCAATRLRAINGWPPTHSHCVCLFVCLPD